MENFKFARANGLKLFIILFTLMMIPRVTRLVVGVSSEEHYIDHNAPSPKSRHYKPPKPPKPEKKAKSIIDKPLKYHYKNRSL